MLRKLVKWVLGITLAIFLIVFIVLPLLANTEEGRRQLSNLLGKALDREVTIGDLDVGLFWRSVDIEKLAIANPEGFPAGPMILAESLRMDASLRKLIGGELKSGLSGSGLTMHIIKKDGKTNLDGFAGSRKRKKKKEMGTIPDLDLRMDLKDGRLIIEDLDKHERLEVNGVSTEMRLTNSEGMQNANLTVTVASVDNKELRIRDLVLDAKLEGDFLKVTEMSAILPGKGTLSGDGRVRVREGNDWTFTFEMRAVSVDADMLPFVATVFPLASSAGGQLDGLLDGTFEVKGNGLTWERMKPTLDGKGRVTITDLGLPAGSLVSLLNQAAGGSAGAITFRSAGAQFGIRNGWVEFNRLSASGKQARYDLAGKVSLDGQLRLKMDLLPLVKKFGGGDAYAKAARYVKQIPIRIEGTTAKPKPKLPSANDLLQSVGAGAIEKGIGGILDRVKKKNR